jgi:hypothetical protein
MKPFRVPDILTVRALPQLISDGQRPRVRAIPRALYAVCDLDTSPGAIARERHHIPLTL